jgi:hypothetical protein
VVGASLPSPESSPHQGQACYPHLANFSSLTTWRTQRAKGQCKETREGVTLEQPAKMGPKMVGEAVERGATNDQCVCFPLRKGLYTGEWDHVCPSASRQSSMCDHTL